MNELTLPQPAAGVWAATRDVVHQIGPTGENEPVIPPHLGGGTVLAARWRHRTSTDIRDAYLDDERLWTSRQHRIEPDELVERAVDAIHNHRYRRLRVDVDGDRITITKTIRGRALPPETYPRNDPAGAVIQSGLAAHLNENGPVPPIQLYDAIRMSNHRNVTMTIFDSGGAGLTWPAEETE